MKTEEFSYIADDGKSVHVYHWAPESKAKACLLVAHGMAEHAGRYKHFAEAVTAAGYEVWAPDHRGHGKTAAEGELGWLAESDGFKRVVADLGGLAARIRSEHPALKLFFLGHSWGSLLGQGFISVYGKSIDGCLLSATTGIAPKNAGIGKLIVGLGGSAKGWRSPAPLADSMSFGAFNKPFEPARTKFDWLSRDNVQVDAYIADPLCGFICSWAYFRDMLDGLGWISAGQTQSAIPKDLPIHLLAGSEDPVGGSNGGLLALHKRYAALGIHDLSYKLYEGGRHEMLNETNRVDVYADLRAWLDAHQG